MEDPKPAAPMTKGAAIALIDKMRERIGDLHHALTETGSQSYSSSLAFNICYNLCVMRKQIRRTNLPEFAEETSPDYPAQQRAWIAMVESLFELDASLTDEWRFDWPKQIDENVATLDLVAMEREAERAGGDMPAWMKAWRAQERPKAAEIEVESPIDESGWPKRRPTMQIIVGGKVREFILTVEAIDPAGLAFRWAEVDDGEG